MTEISHMLVLSTGHLTAYACSDFLTNNIGPWSEKHQDGWFVSVQALNNDTDCDFPLSLEGCLEFAIDQGCDWVMFDRDGPKTEELTYYEW